MTRTSVLICSVLLAVDGSPLRRPSERLVDRADGFAPTQRLATTDLDSLPYRVVSGVRIPWRVASATRLSDGNVVLGDDVTGDVYLLRDDGTVINRARFATDATRGAPTAIWPGGRDTLTLYDQIGRRLTRVLVPTLVTTESIRLTHEVLSPPTLYDFVGLDSDSTAIAIPIPLAYANLASNTLTRRSTVVARVSFDGRVLDSLARVAGLQVFPLPGADTLPPGLDFSTVAATPAPRAALGAGVLFVGESGTPEIKVYDLSGRLLRSTRWEALPDSITMTDRRRYFIEDSLAYVRQHHAPPPDRIIRDLQSIRFAPVAPVFRRLVATAAGGVWVELYGRPWDPRREFLAIDSAGGIRTRVRASRSTRVLQVGDQWVLAARRRDEGGEELRLITLPD